eukprot:snap_masked-scaffold_9-processed-gene-2.30-mRNA-1 protein AED:1.00 eAED:1.00 QI:0/-1/0/0/-1/1/1/0/67
MDENIFNFMNQIQIRECISGLRMNIAKTKILLADEGYNMKEDVPDEDINTLLSKSTASDVTVFLKPK